MDADPMMKPEALVTKAPASAHGHIEITETLVRLYVFLMQHLDRCQYESARAAYPEQELQLHLAATRAEMMILLAVNRVVKHKVEEECDHVFSIAAACLTNGIGSAAALEKARAERAALKIKTMALSDLLAVFRAAVGEAGVTHDKQLVGG